MVKSRFQPMAGASPQQALLGMMVLVVHSPNLGRWGKMAIFSHGEKMGKLWCTIDVGGFPDGFPPKKTKSDNQICWDRKGPQANQAPMPIPGDSLSFYHAQHMVNGKDWTASREKRVEVFNFDANPCVGKRSTSSTWLHPQTEHQDVGNALMSCLCLQRSRCTKAFFSPSMHSHCTQID